MTTMLSPRDYAQYGSIPASTALSFRVEPPKVSARLDSATAIAKSILPGPFQSTTRSIQSPSDEFFNKRNYRGKYKYDTTSIEMTDEEKAKMIYVDKSDSAYHQNLN